MPRCNPFSQRPRNSKTIVFNPICLREKKFKKTRLRYLFIMLALLAAFIRPAQGATVFPVATNGARKRGLDSLLAARIISSAFKVMLLNISTLPRSWFPPMPV